MQCWIETLVQYLPSAMSASSPGSVGTPSGRSTKRRLQTSVGTIELGEVRRLVMDEFALHKGHRYATVIMDAERTRVLWVGHGNSRAAIRPFFEQLGERCQQIEAVAMDMNTAFDLEVKQHCPAGGGGLRPVPRGGSLWPRGGGPGASGAGECTEKR